MIYAIDMDGVIVDSKLQVFIDALNAYLALFPGNGLIREKITLSSYKNIDSRLRDRFYSLTDFAKAAQENVFVLYLIDNKIHVDNDKEFRLQLSKIDRLKLETWHKEFYKQRYEFCKEKDWQKIISPFQEMIDFINRRKDSCIILSNKDLTTIKKILVHYKIRIADKNIFSKEISVDKNEKLTMILKRFKLKPKELSFIDDNFINLRDAVGIGMSCCMASWGYNNQEQQKEARKLGIDVLGLENLKKI